MSGLEALLPLIYHEKQQSGSQLCAQHALNAILQGDFFSAPDLAQFAQQLDHLEGSFDNDAGSVSNNMDDTGFFSVQVLENALKVWGFTLVRWRSQDLRDQQETPHAQMAFILNHQQHWFTLRRFGSLEDPDNGHWFNLNSFLKEPEWVGTLYLGMVLSQAEDEGYSVFAVLPTNEAPDAPKTLPRTEADEVASTLPQPTSSHMGARLSTSRISTSDAVGGSSTAPLSGFEDEDLELQAALQASLMGSEGEIDYAALAASRAQDSSALRATSSSLPTPPTRTVQLPDEPQTDSAAAADDPVAASMARNKAIMQRMLREQEMALREGYEEEVAFGFGGSNGAGAASRRSGESSRVRQAAAAAAARAGEEEEAEAIRRAIEESQTGSGQDEAGTSAPELMDVSDSDDEWRPPQESVPPPAAPSAFGAIGSRVYDDEDSELQAALKASLEGMPEGFVVPPTPPRVVRASLEPTGPSASTAAEQMEPVKEEGEEEEVRPVEVVDAEEMRRRRLARFAGQP